MTVGPGARTRGSGHANGDAAESEPLSLAARLGEIGHLAYGEQLSERTLVRNRGVLSGAVGIEAGDHVCLAYSSDRDYRRILAEYLAEGSRRGERLALLTSSPFAETSVLDDLLGGTNHVGRMIKDGELLILRPETVHLDRGAFDPDAAVQSLSKLVEQALAQGYPGLRVALHLAVWLGNTPPGESWSSYELRLDLLAARSPLTALCFYDARVWPKDDLSVIGSVHPLAIGDDRHHRATGFQLWGNADGSVGLGGEIDIAYSEQIETILRDAAKDAGEPVLDISSLTFSDASGVRAIRAAVTELELLHGTASLRGASAAFKRLWDLMGFGDLPSIEVPR